MGTCPSVAGGLSRLALESAPGLFPDEGLARHEWRQHGTCSGEAPTAWFATIRKARALVRIPEALAKPDEPLSMEPRAIIDAFVQANQGLRPGMMAVVCRDGALQEVRLCLSKDVRDFRPCPDVVRRGCHAPEIQILPPS
jgi:ribonuclease T2